MSSHSHSEKMCLLWIGKYLNFQILFKNAWGSKLAQPMSDLGTSQSRVDEDRLVHPLFMNQFSVPLLGFMNRLV